MKSWLKRMLLSYLPIFFIVVCLLFLLFFAAFRNLSNRETEKANQIMAEHVIQLLDSTLGAIDQVITRETLTNKTLSDFAGVPVENQPFLVYEISKKLTELSLINPIISQVYFVHLNSQSVLSQNSLTPIDQFNDREFIRKVMEKLDFNWSAPRAYREFIFIKEEPVISLVKRVPLSSQEEAWLVVNVQLNALKKMIDELYSAELSQIRVVDRSGHVIYSSKQNAEEARDSVLVSHKASDYTGWEISSGIADTRLFQIVSALSYIWMGTGLLIVIAGVYWIIYVTRRNYKPVKTILNRIQSFSANTAGAKGLIKGAQDDFSFIDSALEDLIRQSSSFEQKHKENLAYKRSFLFFELMKGEGFAGEQQWLEEARELGLPEPGGDWVVVITDIDRYPELCARYSQKDIHLLKFVLSSVFKETGQNHLLGVWYEWQGPSQLVVLFQNRDAAKDLSAKIHELALQVKMWVELNLDYTVTLGIGSSVSRMSDVAESYEEAVEAAGYKSALGLNRVISYSDIGAYAETEMFKYVELIRAAAISFRLGESQWPERLAQLFQTMREDRCPKEQLISLLNDLVYHLFKEMMELPPEYQHLWRNGALPQLNGLISRFESLDEWERRCLEILETDAEAIRQLRVSRSSQNLIHQVKMYIETNYTNTELSLNHLSNAFHLQEKNLSRLFKEQFGEKFVDYLTRVRVSHAKLMLVDSSVPIHEIGERVGYVYVNTFIRAFKKVVGTTPGDYRKELQGRAGTDAV